MLSSEWQHCQECKLCSHLIEEVSQRRTRSISLLCLKSDRIQHSDPQKTPSTGKCFPSFTQLKKKFPSPPTPPCWSQLNHTRKIFNIAVWIWQHSCLINIVWLLKQPMTSKQKSTRVHSENDKTGISITNLFLKHLLGKEFTGIYLPLKSFSRNSSF